MHGALIFPHPFQKAPAMTEPLAPGATIGILGGGQLGRMLSVAAARLGYKTHILSLIHI